MAERMLSVLCVHLYQYFCCMQLLQKCAMGTPVMNLSEGVGLLIKMTGVCLSICVSIPLVSGYYLHNYLISYLHIGAVNSSKWSSDLQWFSATCCPLIGREVSDHYLCHHFLYCFHIRTVKLPIPSEFISIPSSLSDFQTNAGLWFVEWFRNIISLTTSCVTLILKL